MKTIGNIIKEARTAKKISLARLADETKIKKEFLEAIEKEQWQAVPDIAVVTGFVKNIASFLGLNQNQLSAMLRRDYPPKKLAINPKPDIADKFTWTPKLTFYAGVATVAVFILGYLIFQYAKFVRPPGLSVLRPKEGVEVRTDKVMVEGETDPNATIKVNNQPVLVEEDGRFTVEIEIFEGTTEIVISATSRTGKETVVRRTIKPVLD